MGVLLASTKGEARNALARAVFFYRLGEIRDRAVENQRYRASGLNLAVAAIILWNTVYLGRAVDELRSPGEAIPDELLAHIAPLGWEHIAFNGGYIWPRPSPSKIASAPCETRAQPSSTPLKMRFMEDSAMTAIGLTGAILISPYSPINSTSASDDTAPHGSQWVDLGRGTHRDCRPQPTIVRLMPGLHPARAGVLALFILVRGRRLGEVREVLSGR